MSDTFYGLEGVVLIPVLFFVFHFKPKSCDQTSKAFSLIVDLVAVFQKDYASCSQSLTK